jgi:predicted helicase
LLHQSREKEKNFDKIVSKDLSKIVWTDTVVRDAQKNLKYTFHDVIVTGVYRPFFKQRLYFDRTWIHRVYQMPKLFPKPNVKNLVICVSGVGASKDFSALITDCIPDLQVQFNGQAFPLYYFESKQSRAKGLFDLEDDQEYVQRDGISNFIFDRAQLQYGKNVTKEDIFYYNYGFLHSTEYKEVFANDFKKMLPRLPLVEDVRDFWAFSKAGRKLADLHINYESVEPHPTTRVVLPEIQYQMDEYEFYSVEKMRFPKKDQKDTVFYNSRIRIENIPAKAYEYVVNGKSAIEWIMERYQVTVHKESSIKNDPNDWSREVEKPSYILDLLLSIINVSVQTVDIVARLPKVKFS